MNQANHVAIIMDGNGRWALNRRKSRSYGHQQGLRTIEKIVDYAIKKKIPYLTLFTFSSENWKRPKNEVNFLFKLLENYFKNNLIKVIRNGIKVKIIGNKSKLMRNLRKIIKLAENKTKKNKKITIQLALNYGSKHEIINSLKIINKKKQKITNENFEKKLIVIFFIIAFPILLTIIFQVKIYNGIRLFLFIIPFLSMLSAISLYYILKNFKKFFYIKIIFNVIMLFFLIFLQRFIYLTPYHYDYSNFFKIKFINTEKLYVHDYWTTSYKELIKLIKADKSIKSIKSDFCGGGIHIVRYLSHKYSDGKIVFVPYEQADYIIMTNRVSRFHGIMNCFDLFKGDDIAVVKRNGLILSVIRKIKT